VDKSLIILYFPNDSQSRLTIELFTGTGITFHWSTVLFISLYMWNSIMCSEKLKNKLTSICILHHKCDFCYAEDHQLQGTSSLTPPVGTFVPLTPYWGLTPRPHWWTSVPRPPVCGVPKKFLKLNYACCLAIPTTDRVTTFQTTWNSPTLPVEASKDYPVSSVYRYGQQSLFHINEKQGEAR